MTAKILNQKATNIKQYLLIFSMVFNYLNIPKSRCTLTYIAFYNLSLKVLKWR